MVTNENGCEVESYIDEFEEFAPMYEFDRGAFDSAMVYAMGAEDTEEFFRKLLRGVKRVARKVAPTIGRFPRGAVPILSKLPIPQAQVAARVAKLLRRLRFDGASEEGALDAFAEWAAKDRRALPIVAGIAARTLVKRKGNRMSPRARRKVVNEMQRAAKTLVQKGGPKAVRALPKIVKSANRTAAVRRTPTMSPRGIRMAKKAGVYRVAIRPI